MKNLQELLNIYFNVKDKAIKKLHQDKKYNEKIAKILKNAYNCLWKQATKENNKEIKDKLFYSSDYDCEYLRIKYINRLR